MLMIGFLFGYGFWPAGWDQAISCALLVFLMPGLFEGEGRWQRWIGELSYPIYVVHILVKWVILAAQGVERAGQREVSGLGLLAGSFLIAALIEKVFGDPIERWRRRRLRGALAA